MKPAVATGASGAVALVIVRLAGVEDPDLLVSFGVILGLVPSAVSLIVRNGGIVGSVKRVIFGKQGA